MFSPPSGLLMTTFSPVATPGLVLQDAYRRVTGRLRNGVQSTSEVDQVGCPLRSMLFGRDTSSRDELR